MVKSNYITEHRKGQHLLSEERHEIEKGIGDSPTSKNRLGTRLKGAQTEPIAFCDSTGHRLHNFEIWDNVLIIIPDHTRSASASLTPLHREVLQC